MQTWHPSKPSTEGSRIANSSPPNRATESISRASLISRLPIWSSRLSPQWCPRVSLTSLNRSRSISNRPVIESWRRPKRSACSKRSARKVRSASPVSLSCSEPCKARLAGPLFQFFRTAGRPPSLSISRAHASSPRSTVSNNLLMLSR